MPIFVQNLMTSAQGFLFKYHRSSPKIMREYCKQLLESQWNTEEQFSTYQQKEKEKLLRHAFTNVPHYRDWLKKSGAKIEDFFSEEGFRQLPLLSKQELRGNEKSFLDERLDIHKLCKGGTSGTTGTPLVLYSDQQQMAVTWAYISRLRSWMGLNELYYPRTIRLSGKNIVPLNQKKNVPVYWRYNRPFNMLLASSYHLSSDTIKYYIKAFNKFRPEVIESFPSILLTIARLTKTSGLEIYTPKAIMTTAETLFSDARKDIESVFGCHIFDQYGSSETNALAGECEYGQMHVWPEHAIIEILDKDGTPVLLGEEGEIVVTSFMTPIMPLIRYRLGDLGIFSKEKTCKCGRHMPIIQKIIGRTEDTLYFPNRGYTQRFDTALKGIKGIIESQIIQDSLNSLKVLIVATNEFDEKNKSKYLWGIQNVCGEDISIKFEYVDSIPRGANGKLRAVISQVRDQYPIKM
jgi:phenylacetate-CoA ligase